MPMNDLKCPNCNSTFETITEPDIEYEKCPNCMGIFLDKGELNFLATGHSGNIELSSSIADSIDEKFNKRICPKCLIEMQTTQLLNLSGIYFSSCNNCGGFFLDHLKFDQINNYLKFSTINNNCEEFREYIDEVLVRVDIEGHGSTQIFDLLITAYYKKPLNIDLFITQERIWFKISKLLFRNIFKEYDSGDSLFDKHFKIHTSDDVKLRRIFDYTVNSKVLELIKMKPKAHIIHGKLIFYDDRLTYKEGSYVDIPGYQKNDKFDMIIHNLVEIVKQINNNI
jgi:Zn-finger nucleic acid-binding protein